MKELLKALRHTQYGYEFLLRFEPKHDGTYAIKCLKHPRDPHGKNTQHHHLFTTDYICISKGFEPKTQREAVRLGVFWMYGYSEYIATGLFPSGTLKVDIPDSMFEGLD